ncbi:MAG: pilus assembly protein PilN, partial [Thermodesulfobacteriota bacterium]
MIRINLLPYRTARKKENVRQQVTIFLLLIVLITFSLVWYNNKLNKKVEALNTQIEFTRKEVIRYNKIAKEVEEL